MQVSAIKTRNAIICDEQLSLAFWPEKVPELLDYGMGFQPMPNDQKGRIFSQVDWKLNWEFDFFNVSKTHK